MPRVSRFFNGLLQLQRLCLDWAALARKLHHQSLPKKAFFLPCKSVAIEC